MILSSRSNLGPTTQEVLDASTPAVQLANWAAIVFVFPSLELESITQAQKILIDILGCLELADFAVVPSHGLMAIPLEYFVAVKPFTNGPFVQFRIQFKVQP